MGTTHIDVHDLPEEKVNILQRLVDLFRTDAQTKQRAEKPIEEDESRFGTHHSDVIGNLTRKEIYDYL